MNPVVHYQLHDGIATIGIANGKVNAISPQVVSELNAALDQAIQDKAVVILTGQPGVLSGGYDLKVMMSSRENAIALVTAGSMLTRRLLAHPFPLVVACSGHAVAKGAFLLLACDYRIGVSGAFTIGLNEVQIGMTMHHAGIAMARDRLTPAYFQRSVVNAEMFNPEGALAAGFLDTVVAPEQLTDKASEIARQLGKLNMTAHGATKLKSRRALLEALDAAIEIDKVAGLG